MILERIRDPALSNIPLTTRREGKYDEICKKLSLVYGGAIEVGQNIMGAHMKTGKIPDPSYYPEAALKILRSHAECMEHANRFITLSNDPAADAEIMTGANLKQILNLLPLRIRQQDKEFHTAETNVEKRKKQYLKIKEWVSEMLETLVLGGTSQSEKPDTKVTEVVVNDHQQDGNRQTNGNNKLGRGSRQQRQDTRNSNKRNYTPRNQVTECGLCNIIQGKEVSQDYISMDFNDRHQKVGDRPIFPNMCLPWMMLTMEEREKVLEDNDLFCRVCLRFLRKGRGGNTCGPG